MGARSAPPGQTNGTVTTTRPPRHRTRPAACRRAQARRYCGVVDDAPRLVSPVRPDRTLRWHARPPRSLQPRTPRRLPVTRARARGRASPAAAALSARSPSSCPELNSTEQDVQHRCHLSHRPPIRVDTLSYQFAQVRRVVQRRHRCLPPFNGSRPSPRLRPPSPQSGTLRASCPKPARSIVRAYPLQRVRLFAGVVMLYGWSVIALHNRRPFVAVGRSRRATP